MKPKFTLLWALFITSFFPSVLHCVQPEPSEILIENFTPSPDENGKLPMPGSFPDQWHHRSSDALTTYGLAKEGSDYYLKARSFKTGTQILKKFKIELQEYPILRWRWRVDKFPGETENKDMRSRDNGASVYIIFSGFLRRAAIKYVFSNHFKKGAFIDNRSNMKTFVLRDSSDPKSKWLNEERNVYEDYKKSFGKEPPKLTGIALMTDSDQTETFAEADYDDFVIMKKPGVGKSQVIKGK